MKQNEIKKLAIPERIAITRRAYKTIKKYCPGLIQTTMICALVAALQPFATIWFSAQILNGISSGSNHKKTIILAVLIVIINYILSLLKNWFDTLHGEQESQMWCYFSKIFADKQLSMDYVDIEDSIIQKRKNKEKENLFMFGNGLGQFVWTVSGLIEGTVSIFASILLVFTLFSSSSGNTVIDSPFWIMPITLAIVFGAFANSKAFKKQNEVFICWSENSVWFNRLFTFFGWTLCINPERSKDVRIYRQDILADRMMEKLEQKDKSEKSYFFQMSIYEAVSTLIVGLNYALIYLFVALKALFGAFGVGSVVQYVGALSRLSHGVQQLILGITDNAVYTGHLKSLFEFLDLPNKKYQGTLPVEKRNDNEYEIEFKDVSFRYPGTENYALKKLNLKFKIGESLAVVGMNGSGKTTMIKLLCRLYDATEGEITLNKINIKKYNYNEYMSIFSVVFQDFKLFSFSLGQNVSTSVEYDCEKAKEALKQAGFIDRFSTMMKGLDTALYKDFEEEGVEISGGEAQKIALARALYKNAPFIVLDEPTAALDPVAEFEIYSKFNEIVGDKTAIYISHRLSSCRFCDDIVVFHEGQLIQRGKHDTLIADTSGKYYELWNAQAQYYTENKII